MKISSEKKLVSRMIHIYCRHREGNRDLCQSCAELLEYSESRLDRCPFGDGKTSCRNCRVHCYDAQMRRKIREVMRFSGPRIIFYAPLETICHLLSK